MCRSHYRSITLRDVLSSKKSEPEETPQPQMANDRSKSGPTPSRKQAQARNDHSLIVADRKAAKKAARERARAMRLEQDRLQQEALITGDERYMPLRDKGKAFYSRLARCSLVILRVRLPSDDSVLRGFLRRVFLRLHISCRSARALHCHADHVRPVLHSNRRDQHRMAAHQASGPQGLSA